MAEMNQLLDEAAQGCAELAARAEKDAASAHDVLEQAQLLATRAVDDGQKLHAEYTAAIAAVEAASAHAGSSVAAAARVVQEVPAEAVTAAQALQTMLGKGGEALSTLAQERARVFHELDETARQAETAFHDLGDRMEIYADHVDARLHDAASQLEHLQSVGKDIADRLEKAQHSLHEELTDLGKVAAKITESTAHALEQMLAAVSSGLLDFANNAIEEHNQLTAAARQGFVDETKDAPTPESTYVSDAFDKLHDAVGRLESVLEPGNGALQSTTAACTDAAEKATGDLHAALQDLDKASQQVSP